MIIISIRIQNQKFENFSIYNSYTMYKSQMHIKYHRDLTFI